MCLQVRVGSAGESLPKRVREEKPGTDEGTKGSEGGLEGVIGTKMRLKIGPR